MPAIITMLFKNANKHQTHYALLLSNILSHAEGIKHRKLFYNDVTIKAVRTIMYYWLTE